jgi:hypothetical protein
MIIIFLVTAVCKREEFIAKANIEQLCLISNLHSLGAV